MTALTSAEISLPAEADGQRVSDRIAVLADTVDVVGLTDNHAGQPRMSPLAAVALAREQGVGTIVHVSCRDRNRLALQSQVVGAAALGAEGVLCMQGDPVAGVDHVADMTPIETLTLVPLATLIVGAVVQVERMRERGGPGGVAADGADRHAHALLRPTTSSFRARCTPPGSWRRLRRREIVTEAPPDRPVTDAATFSPPGSEQVGKWSR